MIFRRRTTRFRGRRHVWHWTRLDFSSGNLAAGTNATTVLWDGQTNLDSGTPTDESFIIGKVLFQYGYFVSQTGPVASDSALLHRTGILVLNRTATIPSPANISTYDKEADWMGLGLMSTECFAQSSTSALVQVTGATMDSNSTMTIKAKRKATTNDQVIAVFRTDVVAGAFSFGTWQALGKSSVLWRRKND